jgi:hypothetical protein
MGMAVWCGDGGRHRSLRLVVIVAVVVNVVVVLAVTGCRDVVLDESTMMLIVDAVTCKVM